MPRAPRSTTRASAASRTDPLKPKSGNSRTKAAPKSSKSEEKTTTPASTNQPVASPDHDAKSQTAPPATANGIDSKFNYLILVHMTMSSNPIITRLLSLPPQLTFEKFHEVLQIAFGWANCHSHFFSVKLTIDPDKNPLARRVLHLQPGLRSDMEHLDYTPQLTSEYTLHDVFSRTEWEDIKVTPEMELSIEYEYDFRCCWEHQIVLLGRADPGLNRMMGGPEAPPILCLAGEGHPCAEGCRGPSEWKSLKELFAKPRGKDPMDLKDWYREECANGDPKGLDPWTWNIRDVNAELMKMEV